jgi:hypothetical protein
VTKLEELEVDLNSAYAAAFKAANDPAYNAAARAWDAYEAELLKLQEEHYNAAYEAELKKTQEEETMTKLEELKAAAMAELDAAYAARGAACDADWVAADAVVDAAIHTAWDAARDVREAKLNKKHKENSND